MQEKIRSWNLPLETEDHLYDILDLGLTSEALNQLSRLPAPNPTFLWDFDFQDAVIHGMIHYCTFWLTFGPVDDCLYVMNCDHAEEENWDPDGSDGPPL